MNKTIPLETSADEEARIQQEIQHYFQEIEQANERMKSEQAEIMRAKTRTRAMLAEIAGLGSR